MNKLATYIFPIKNGIPYKIVSERLLTEDRIQEDGVVTVYTEQTVRFVNGITIQQHVGWGEVRSPTFWRMRMKLRWGSQATGDLATDFNDTVSIMPFPSRFITDYRESPIL